MTPLRIILCLCLLVGLSSAQPLTINSLFTNSTTGSSCYAILGNPIILNLSGGLTTIWFSADGVTFVQVGNNYTVEAAANSNSVVPSTSAIQKITWSGLSSTNTPVDANAAAKVKNYQYKLTSNGTPVVIPWEIALYGGQTVYESSNSGTLKVFNRPVRVMGISPDGFTGNDLDEVARDEINMMIMNTTGIPQTIPWGDSFIDLEPGLNQIRYDGPVDANGMPSVRPSDFTGTLITENGITSLVAVLGQGIETSVGWQLAPLRPPAEPVASPVQGVVEIITPPSSTSPGLLSIRNANGTTTLTRIEPIPVQTTSNTSGGSAVLSNPTQPKPAQTTTNVFNNITNQTTNNTSTINNSTYGSTGSTGDSITAINTNGAEIDGLTGIASVDSTADPTMSQSLEAMTDSFFGQQTTAVQRVTSKFWGFSDIIAVSAIPKIMSYSHSLSLPGFGTYNLNLDFTKVPFPQFRMAVFVCMTLYITQLMMKRLTI